MTKNPPTNLKILKPSRIRIKPGDIFTYKMPDGLYRFGRVISVTASIGTPAYVKPIYLYASTSTSKDDIPEDLTTDNLLLPPTMINNLPWSGGYFEVVRREKLKPGDALPRHCFRRSFSWRSDQYVDEHGDRINDPVEPIGTSGLSSFRSIDDELSNILGFELAPD